MSKLADIGHVALLVFVTLGVALIVVGYHEYWRGVDERVRAQLLAEKNGMLEDAFVFAPRDSTPDYRHVVVKRRIDDGSIAEFSVSVLINDGKVAAFRRASEDTNWSSSDRQEDQVTALNRVKRFVSRLKAKPIILGE